MSSSSPPSDTGVTKCQSVSCNQRAIGVAPCSHLELCQEHMAQDIEKVKARHAALTSKLQRLKQPEDRQRKLGAEQAALEAEVLEVGAMFQAVLKKLQRWQATVEARVQVVRDAVGKVLQDSGDAEKYSSELARWKMAELAENADNNAGLMRHVASIEPWADVACGRLAAFERTRSELRDRQSRRSNRTIELRSVGDVAAGVQQLQFMIDRHMADVMQQCWLDEGEASSAAASPRPVCRSLTTIGDLGGQPCYVTCCTNISGFVASSSGCVMKQPLPAEGDCTQQPPQPWIYVTLKDNGIDPHLLVTSLDGTMRLKCQCSSLDWSQWISGLHCDSERQLLFLAQYRAVTVADLAGTVTQVITADSLGLTGDQVRFAAMTGSSDKLLLLNTTAHKVHVLPLVKPGSAVEDPVVSLAAASAINVSSFNAAGELSDLALHGSKILLVDTDSGQVLRVCGISGQLIDICPRRGGSGLERLDKPVLLAVDTSGSGNVFVNECARHAIRVLSTSGDTLLETLGDPGSSGSDDRTFNWPFGLCVLAVREGEKLLIVVDRGNDRLRLFQLL